MTKSTLDLVDIVWSILNVSPLKAAINGDICKHRRTGNSNLEDVVVNSLPITMDQLQAAIVNVNIHVPDIEVNKNGINDIAPNHARLKSLCAVAITSLKDKWGDEYSLEVQQQNLFRDEEAKDHYINIRIEIYNVNL